ncbi:MAG: nicotinate (nicotinamide) nucleotide adenylyltransferase [Candidimonas sp.]|nr:MAG: nicotinate (nicotinamide) nucleotide adenylyltransferase [Candidimonas sp.]TAM25104.1 MAG: nicotinate (nicotinamide) nucleotide adenylyltransferase [Candidimonas sp.]TAM77203.1 MAG: nicotinate (nicotinamide) nucleotide adenylyltransferase [Candidimonas sp.]
MVVKKIGLLGGSFDPVHLAHTALAQASLHILQLDELQLIPAANPWQRSPLQATGAQRLTMLKLAIEGLRGLSVNPVEIERGGPTYTIDTLRQLADNAEYYWILGADQLDNFCSWRDWQEIVQRVHLVVAQRPETPATVPAALTRRLDALNHRLFELPFDPMPISATAIRQRLADGQSVHGMLNVAVAQFIAQHKLYQSTL